jgi:hypothetical protein
MNFEELQRNWKSEVNRSAGSADLQRLLVAIQEQCDGLERSAHRRDVREILTAIVVVAFFAAGWPVFRHSMAASLGMALIVLGYFIFVFALLVARRPAPMPLNASVLEFSRQRLAWIDRQIHLLTTAVWWYVTPSFVGVPLAAWGLTSGNHIFFIVLTLFFIVASVQYVYSRRRTARNRWQPVRDEIARLLEDLEAMNSPERT